MIDMNKKYKTSKGLSVRVLCTDVKSEYSVVAAVLEKEGTESLCSYTKEGVFWIGETDSNDLVEVSPYEDFKVDDLCVVGNELEPNLAFRYFAKEVNGKAHCFDMGTTSFTADKDNLMKWTICRKATPEEIQTRTIKG